MPRINVPEERHGTKRREIRGRNENTRGILKKNPMNKCKKRKDTILRSKVSEVCTLSLTSIQG